MIRDFSESAKQKLLAYVKDVTETTVWGKLGDIIGDIGLQVQHWFGALDISKHVNNLDEYHKKVIDKNDTTSQRIEEIFTNVKNIDIRYQNGLGQELSYANSITDMIKVLSDTIDPNGGNMNLQKMNEALAASLEKIRENQLSKNKVIEDSMLGTDPDAAEMSADPVNLSTGNFVYDHQDLIVGGEIPLVFHRYYNSKDTRVGTLGKCFLHNYEVLIEDSNDGVLGIRQADGQVIRYEKDNDGNYHSNTSALEILKKTETGYVLENIGKERKLFKSDGKLIRQENWNGRGISFSYNEKNQLVKAKTDNESCFEYFYDESSGYLTKVQDHTGRCVDLTYKNGMLEKVALPLDIVYTYTYGSNGRIIEVVNAREIHAVKNEYDKKYRVTKQFFPDGGMMSFLYDDEKRCVVLTERNGVKTTYFYDENYRNTETVFEDGTSEKFLYNEKNQCISKTDRLGRTQRMAYDNRGNLTSIIDEKGNKTTYDYSPNGNLMKVTDALGNETFYEYDAMNRLVKTLCTGANGEESQNTDFVWDVMGQIKSVTDPLGYVESYEYDKNGNMTSKTDRDGYTINFTYGSHGKIEEIVYADGKTVEMSYDALRRLNEVKDWNGITKITLDAIGRALSVTEPNGDTVGYEWGLMGEKKAVIYPNGKRAEYSYNTEMQLVSLHTERETIQYAYDEIGRLTKKILPNGIETNYHYNAMGRVDEISHIGNEFAESYKYSFDIYGNKVSAIKNRVGAEVDNGHFAYVYDELNRLTEVHQNDTLLRKYSYDAFGNRVSKANYASRMESVTSYTYNVNNQLLSEVDGTMTKDYTYDNRGNLLKVSTGADILKEFTFDATNQMTASFDLVDGQRKKATYTYNGLGHRVGQKISSLIPEYPEKKIRYTIDMTRQYYNLLQKSEGGASQTYYWDGNVVGMESNGVEKFYLQDDFGSPMHLVDIYGTSQECFAFDEFGENLSTSYNNTSQTFGFTGYQTDEVGDLYYAQARRYDASVGRFVSEDKVRGFVILPYTLNHYGYCWNNPVDFVDRDGNLPTVVIGAVIGLAAGALGEVVSQTIDGVQSGKSVLDSLLDVNPGKVVLEAGKGAVTGAVAGTGAGLLVVAGTSGVVEFGGDLLDQKVLQKKEDLDYTHAISNGLWSATTTLVVGGITNEISNVIHPEAKTGTMDYLFGRDKAKAVVKAQYNNARSSSSRAKYWNRLEKIKLQKTLGTIKYGIIETGKTIIDEIKNEIYRDEVNEDIVEEIDKKISCSVY